MFYIQVGVSLQRQQSSRSPGCIRLLDSSVSAGVSSERDGQRDRQETGTMGEREKEAAKERTGEERRTVRKEKKRDEGRETEAKPFFPHGIKGDVLFCFLFFSLCYSFSVYTQDLSLKSVLFVNTSELT